MTDTRKRRTRTPAPAETPVDTKTIENTLHGFAGDLLAAMGITHVSSLIPNRILKSGNATIVFWEDGSKTVVKCPADCTPDDYQAFTAALAIHIFGSNSKLKKMIARKTVYQKEKKKGDVEE